MGLLALLCTVFVSYSAVMAREPQCSRFHYEEQLLEKVIRSEIRMETLDTAMEKVRTDMEAELIKLKGNNRINIILTHKYEFLSGLNSVNL